MANFIGKNGLILYIKYYIINFIVYAIFYVLLYLYTILQVKIIKIQKIKGTRNLYASLIFYDFECVKFDSNCPHMTPHIDPNSPYFLTPILTTLDSVQNGLKRSKMVKSYIFKFCEVPKTLDFQHFSHMDQTGVEPVSITSNP